MTLQHLAAWLRGFAQDAQAPAGQPNTATENLLETAAFIEAYNDMRDGTRRKNSLAAAVKQHNAELVEACSLRRADTSVPCGGSKGVRCADCPRTLGLTAGNRTIPG